jgi:hypothetical protein
MTEVGKVAHVHLKESPDYYRKLKKMENVLKKASEFKKKLEKTIFNSESYQSMLASEKVLAKDWEWPDRPIIGYVVNLTRLNELRKSFITK